MGQYGECRVCGRELGEGEAYFWLEIKGVIGSHPEVEEEGYTMTMQPSAMLCHDCMRQIQSKLERYGLITWHRHRMERITNIPPHAYRSPKPEPEQNIH